MKKVLDKYASIIGMDVDSLEVRELIAEYDLVAKQLYQMDDVGKLMLEIARVYKSNIDVQEGIDSTYGTGFTSYLGSAIEAFYNS